MSYKKGSNFKLSKPAVIFVALIIVVILGGLIALDGYVNRNNFTKRSAQTKEQLNSYEIKAVTEEKKSTQAVSSSQPQLSILSSQEEKPNYIIRKKLKLPILMYHHIADIQGIDPANKIAIGLRVSPKVFEEQVEYITKKGYKAITVNNLYDYSNGKFPLPEKPIILTFDDGYKDNFTNAYPILRKFNQVGDFAIITGVLGRSEYMSWEDVKTMSKDKMGISSHTFFHCYLAIDSTDPKTKFDKPFMDSPTSSQTNQKCPSFTFGGQLNTSQIRGELETSKKDLESNLNIKIRGVVYPYGKYNKQVMDIAKNLDYSYGFTTRAQVQSQLDLDNPFEISRIRINGQQAGDMQSALSNL